MLAPWPLIGQVSTNKHAEAADKTVEAKSAHCTSLSNGFQSAVNALARFRSVSSRLIIKTACSQDMIALAADCEYDGNEHDEKG